jgi:hypothetical protein
MISGTGGVRSELGRKLRRYTSSKIMEDTLVLAKNADPVTIQQRTCASRVRFGLSLSLR